MTEEDENADAQPKVMRSSSRSSKMMLICRKLSDLICPWATSAVLRNMSLASEDICKSMIKRVLMRDSTYGALVAAHQKLLQQPNDATKF